MENLLKNNQKRSKKAQNFEYKKRIDITKIQYQEQYIFKN